MSHRIAALYERVVLRHPWLALALLGFVMAALLPGLRNFKLDASTDALLLESDKDLRSFRQLAMRYQTRDFLFVAVVPKDGDVFTPATLGMISDVRDELTQVAAVKDIITVLDVPLLSTVTGRMADLGMNFETLRSHEVKLEVARQELTTSPLYRNLVASADGKVGAMQIFLKDHPRLPRLSNLRDELLYKRIHGGLSAAQEQELARLRPDYEQAKEEYEATTRAAIAEIRAILAKHSGQATLYLGGMPMIIDDMMTFIHSDMATFGGAVLLFLVVMMGIIFREVRWVALPFASCLYASTAMFGLLGLVGWKVTIISTNFVSLMLILTMSMNIHLVVRYRELLRDHPDMSQQELVRRTAMEMARPSFYTVLTNIIGFGSFVLCDIKPVIDFGWMMSIGLLVAFASTFMLFPALLVMTRRRALTRPESQGYAFTEWLAHLTERHGKAILVVSLLVAVVATLGTRRLEVENSFVSYFHKDTEIHQGLSLIDQQLGGTTPLDIVLKFPPDEGSVDATHKGTGDLAAMFDDVAKAEQAPSSWFSDAKIARLKAVHAWLEKQPEIGKVLSLDSTLRVAEAMNDGKPLGADGIETIYRQMPDAAKANLFTPFVSVYDNEMRLSARIIDTLPGLQRKELLARIDSGLRERLKLKSDEYEISGLLVLYNNVLQSLYKSQILTFGSAMACIMVPLLVMFRSLKAAIIGILPNLLGAVTILGFMGWAKIPLDIMTITIASITIGIAVEDCIHYLYSYKLEYRRLRDPLATMHYCHNNVAKAGFYTTVTVVVGFSILMLSNFIPTILFGLLTAVAMSVALLAALTLMPQLVLWWQPFRMDDDED
ncbi:MAG: MMPL family transporter [Proteobacteria bacterium]|nr:MMPL family transporter [Pseudomonadota bacterium]